MLVRFKYVAPKVIAENALIGGEESSGIGSAILGDYSSFYLAILNKVDSTPVDSIDFVKKYLARFPPASS